MKQMEHKIKSGVMVVPIFIGGLFLFSLIVWWLWNAVLPAAVPGIKVISYWQAMGIFALSKILFGFNKGWGGHRRQWKEKMEAKWNNMTPEEREKFKNEWRNRCGSRWSIGSRGEDSSSMAARHETP